MKISINILASFFSIMAISACSEELTPADYIKMVEKKGSAWTREKKIDPYLFEVFVRTPEYETIRLLNADKSELRSPSEIMKDKRGRFLVSFRFMAIEGNADIIKNDYTADEYTKRIEYLSGAVQQDFLLVKGKDTITSSLTHFERTYNINPKNEMLVEFDTPWDSLPQYNNLQLIFNDRLFTGQPQVFNLNKEIYKNHQINW
jgi:hypothetical protein